MNDIKERFANNSDDWRITDAQLLCRASVKRKSRTRPTKNSVANVAPWRLRWYFNNNDCGFIACRVLKRNMYITVRFSFHSSDAARESVPFILNPGAPDWIVKCTSMPGQPNTSEGVTD